MRIQEFCDNYNVQVVPHGWASGVTGAAVRHFFCGQAELRCIPNIFTKISGLVN